MTQAFGYIGRIFTRPDWWVLSDGTIYRLGLKRMEMNILLTSLWILFAVSVVKYRRHETLDEFLAKQCAWFRWLAVALLFAFIFLFGIYGPGFDESQFIYFQF